jgi:hypothetical protein
LREGLECAELEQRSTENGLFLWPVLQSLQIFFLPDLFFIEKKATAIIVTNYITGIIIETYNICRYLQQNE